MGEEKEMNKIIWIIRNLQSRLRYNKVRKHIIGTSLDVGSGNNYHDWINEQCDISPMDERIKKEDITNLSYANDSYDTVICMEVLEHLLNPLKAIDELKRIAKKRIIISVPLEPYFSIARMTIWNKDHLWAITPKLLSHYLGKPIYEQWFWFRWYFAIYQAKKGDLWIG